MPWVRKQTAPEYDNLAESILAIIPGTPDDWVLPWVNLIPGNRIMGVDTLCAAGPPAAVELSVFDFLGFIGGGRVGAAAGTMGLSEKLASWSMGKLFEAYCEFSDPAGFSCYVLAADVTVDDPGEGPTGVAHVTVPAGTQEIYVKYLSSTFNGSQDMNILGASLISNEEFGTANWDTPDDVCGRRNNPRNFLFAGGASGVIDLYTNKVTHCEVTVCGTFGVITPPDVVPDLAQPASAIPRTPKVYTTIADLGAELDAIEGKLHWVLDYTSGSVATQVSPLVADESIPVDEPDSDIPLGPEVKGFIVTCSNPTADVDLHFAEPRRLHRMGRVVIGNGVAWQPPIEITVSPMLLLKTSTFQTAVRVQLEGNATAIVTTLVEAPTLG